MFCYTAEEEFSHGQVKLLLYTRAELRTSDHRYIFLFVSFPCLQCHAEGRADCVLAPGIHMGSNQSFEFKYYLLVLSNTRIVQAKANSPQMTEYFLHYIFIVDVVLFDQSD